MKALTLILKPFSWMYAGVLGLRHLLYDKGVFRSSKAAVPALVIGNLELGGTGKTPHTIMMAGHLQVNYEVAVLSRGYGRSTKGFMWVEEEMHAGRCGDESLLIKRHFPEIQVAVGEDRVEAIRQMKEEMPGLQWIILDDAFQHRKLDPEIRILLTPFERPFFQNELLPAGTLRDIKKRWKSADMVIITKTPEGLTEKEILEWVSQYPELTTKPVFFSEITYGRPVGVFNGKQLDFQPKDIIGISGLANNSLFENHLKTNYNLKKFKSYPDHYDFNATDLQALRAEFGNFAGYTEVILMTEKDAVKWRNIPGAENLPVYYVPISPRVNEVAGRSWESELDFLIKKVKR